MKKNTLLLLLFILAGLAVMGAIWLVKNKQALTTTISKQVGKGEQVKSSVDMEKIKKLNLACRGGVGDKASCLEVAKIRGEGIWQMTPSSYRSHQAYHLFKWASTTKNNYVKEIDDFYNYMSECGKKQLESCHAYAMGLLKQGIKKLAAEQFGDLCKKDFKKSCLQAGNLASNTEDRRLMYQKACEYGAIKGCLFYKLMQEVTPEKKQELRALYGECQRGDQQSCQQLSVSK